MLILILALLHSPTVEAAPQKAQVQARVERVQPKPEPEKMWAAEVEWHYNGSFRPSGDESRKTSTDGLAKVAITPGDRLAIQGVLGFNQILEPTQEFQLTNPEFRAFYRTLGKKSGWSLLLGPTAALPLSQTSQDESLYFSMGAAARALYNAQTSDEVGFKFYYDLGFNRNIHQYDTSNTGDVNTMCSLNHYLQFEYAFDSPFAISAWGGFSSAWSYEGLINNEFTAGQELAYAVSEQFELGLGHERGGDFLSSSGQSYNFSLFDASESRFYLLMKVVL